MTRLFKIVTLLLAFSFLWGCNTYKKPFYSTQLQNWQPSLILEQDIQHQIFLIGDAGIASEDDPIMLSLKQDLAKAGKDDVVIFLGDNIYPKGLEAQSHPGRAESQRKLDAQLNAVKQFQGRKYFIPGNHDWKKGAPEGLEYIQRQAKYVREYLGEKDAFLPFNGCGDPEKERISEEVAIIFIDSQWWLQDWTKTPDINGGCDVQDRLGFLDELKDLLAKYEDEQVLLVMHHPIFSNGAHGGYFSVKQNLFPLTDINDDLLVPMLGFGSLYSLYRKTTGDVQDIPHTAYQALKNELLNALAPYNNVIVAAGHEHSLQYFNENNHHFIVSGAGSKKSYTRKGVNAQFTSATKGYSKLTILKNGAIYLDFFAFREGNKHHVLQTEIVQPLPKKQKENLVLLEDDPTTFPDSILVKPSEKYDIENGEFFFGEQYRKAWSTEVKVPVFLLQHEKGGLRVLKPGGGQSSLSLRMENPEGKQYVLRTVDKNVEKALPQFIQNTWAIDLAQDQISASHPFAAIAVKHLAEAAGIYHTNPKIVYVPKQHALGEYNERFGDNLYLFEERPAKDRSDLDSFGNSEDIISYRDLIEHLEKSPKHQVDQAWTLRSRIFDMFIHDWDRHDDQWRWASFKQEDGTTLYRPIPRDRDQPFYKFKGLVPYIASRDFAVPKFQNFDTDLKNVKGWNFNARYFDRYFLTKMTREDFVNVAQQIANSISDKDIEDAFKEWPKEIYDIDGEEIIRILKERKKNLPHIAERQYEYLARHVSVVGTNKKEEFEITRKANGEVTVVMMDKDKENTLYTRTFLPKETKEVRIYGLDGNDDFKFLGEHSSGIKVRIIGGNGEDRVQVEDEKSVRSSNTIVYDRLGQMEVEGSLRNKLSNEFEVNQYNRTDFKPNTYLPLLNAAANVDDGLLIGPGVTWIKQGFRKEPYSAKYSFSSNISPSTNAYNVDATADWRSVFGKKAGLSANVFSHFPQFRNWYGGFAGQSSFDGDLSRQFYWTRLDQNHVELMFTQAIGSNPKSFFKLGPVYDSYELEDQASDRIALPIPANEARTYLGGKAELNIDTREGVPVPKEGAHFNLSFQHLNQLDVAEESSLRNASGSFSLLFNLGQQANSILAMRIGGDAVVGDYQFFQAPSLGNNTYLRGFRRDRFYGKQVFYQNVDLRQKLFNWNNRIIPGQLGIVGGVDNGKAWHPNGNTEWNTSFTGGVYYTPFNIATITTGYSKPTEEVGQATFQVGFFF